MGRRGPKETEYVCCALVKSNCISKTITAETSEAAVQLFMQEYGVHPSDVHGPFYRKRAGVLDFTKELQFSDKRYKAIYGDWIVNATVLLNVDGFAHILFDKRVDGKKETRPSGNHIVKLNMLKEITK